MKKRKIFRMIQKDNIVYMNDINKYKEEIELKSKVFALLYIHDKKEELLKQGYRVAFHDYNDNECNISLLMFKEVYDKIEPEATSAPTPKTFYQKIKEFIRR